MLPEPHQATKIKSNHRRYQPEAITGTLMDATDKIHNKNSQEHKCLEHDGGRAGRMEPSLDRIFK